MARPNQRLERIDQLAAFLRVPAMEFIQAVEMDLRLVLLIVYTYRSPQLQHQLYSQGREYRRDEGVWTVTNKKSVVTNTLSSAHNVQMADGTPASVAMDVIPFSSNGTLAWDTSMAVWEKIWALGWKHGFDPLGDTVGAYLRGDQGHFEEPGWKMKLSGLGLIRPHYELPDTV